MFDRVSKIEKACRRYPRVPLFARFAEECLRRGRLRRAQTLCKQGCERFPGYPTGFFMLSRCYELQKMWEEARTAMGQGLRLDPDNPSGYRRLAGIYRHLHNDTLALKCLERAALLDPLSETLSHELENMSLALRRIATRDEGIDAAVPVPVERPTPTEPAESANAPGAAAPSMPEPVVPEPVVPEPVVPDPVVPDPVVPEPASIEEPQELPTPVTAPDEDLDAPYEDPVAEDPVAEDPVAKDSVAENPVAEAHGIDVDALIEMPAVGDLVGESVDEPFGQVQPQPEWDLSEVVSDIAAPDQLVEPVVEEPVVEEPVAEEPAFDPGVDDEVAALGAGLFEDDARDPVRKPPAPARAGRPAVDAVALPEPPPSAAPQGPARAAAEPVIDLPMKSGPEPEPTAQIVRSAGASVREPGAIAEAGVAQLAGRRGSALAELLSEFEETPARPVEETEPGEEAGKPVATVTLAEIYAGQGHHEQALEVYQRVLRADPDNETARRGAAELSIT